MNTFWDHYGGMPSIPKRDAQRPEPSSQNDTRGTCDFCGEASDDVILGVCGPCSEETA